MAHEREHTEHSPLMPIGSVVSRLHERYPDISHSSLRFLEREGIIVPSRTPGGHRLYSERDISRIIQVKEWQRQHLPLEVIRSRLEELDEATDLSALTDAFIERGLAGRFLGAGRLLIEANDRGVPLIDLFADVLAPALIDVGNGWAAGTVLVAQEKQFSETSREVIAELTQRHAWIDAAKPTLLAACVEGNRHELGLRMIVGILRSNGWPVHFLGADVAPAFLLEAVRLHHPRFVLLSVDDPEREPQLQQALDALRRDAPHEENLSIVVGGRLTSEMTGTFGSGEEIVIHETGLRDVVAMIQRTMDRLSENGPS